MARGLWAQRQDDQLSVGGFQKDVLWKSLSWPSKDELWNQGGEKGSLGGGSGLGRGTEL